MRIRRDVVFISSVLFTVAFLLLIPQSLSAALTGLRPNPGLDAGLSADAGLLGDLGTVCLAVIFVGLIVTWAGYVKRVRWTWFVMFTIVWIWAFPILVLPLLQHKIALTWTEWIYSSLGQSGSPRIWAESVLIFALMVIALILPAKAFFQGGKSLQSGLADHL